MKMRSPPFSPEIERALRVDVSAVLLFTVFASLTTPFIGLILRRELGATPLQLSVMSAAGGACLLLSLAWARALCGHAPLPYLVWPSFVARGLFLLMPLASSAWLFVSLIVATNVFGAAAAPAQAGPGPREDGGRGVGRRARARRGSALRARGLPRDFPRRGRARDGRQPAPAVPAGPGGLGGRGGDRRRAP